MAETDSPIAFPVNILRLPASGMPVRLEADEEQRRQLADLHDLVEVTSLRADLVVSAWKRDGVKVEGRVKADIVQSCVVSLEPVESTLDAQIHALFVPEGSKLARPDVLEGGEMLLDAEGDDGPEPFSGDTIDVGALAEEFFSLGIDPYPRKSGVATPQAVVDQDEKRGPLYDKLKGLKDRG